ncbi:hypothetical protein [Streptomyces sp. H27-C3]|uniref:hypothetical protein n=1 Tax=Streptomyces sp. H27-C3 TaxID=3046305 RepID=UPI0024B8E302|nr:hypothetical protein [Streptomyces sp. H27-C3]MDJ0460399.1 hypothetical protein [Streptomyces sp. H27-C3]
MTIRRGFGFGFGFGFRSADADADAVIALVMLCLGGNRPTLPAADSRDHTYRSSGLF